MNRSTYQMEEDELLKVILDKRFFSIWKNSEGNKLWELSNLELYITSECNLKCEYCYLNTRGDQLYPKEFRKEELIYENLLKIFDWWLENDFYVNELSLFSGEIWHLPYGIKILETILSYTRKGLRLRAISLPTNSTFILEDATLNQMQYFVDSFKECGTSLIISHSVDGIFLEDISRPMKSTTTIRDQSFYDRLFIFAKKNNFFFHPMVSAVAIEKWNDNYDWFKEMCVKYDMKFPDAIMMLEVRNPDWTDEKLEYLKKYYTHQIVGFWEEAKHNFDNFLAKVFCIGGDEPSNGYINIAMPMAKTQAGCTIPSCLFVRVGDLSLVPCHRTAYPQYIYGKFELENGKIIGVNANNTAFASKIYFSNNLTSHHGCDVCQYNGFCLRGCFGEQYENTEDAFMPDPIVCNMFKTKYNHLIDVYVGLGVFEYMSKISSSDFRYIMCQQILLQVDRVQKERVMQNAK